MSSLKFEQVISNLKYGTMLTVTEAQTKREVWNREFPWHASVSVFSPEVRGAEISLIEVRNGGLVVEIVPYTKEEAE